MIQLFCGAVISSIKNYEFKMLYKNIKRNNNQSGAVMLVVMVFFLFITLSIVMGIISPTVRAYQDSSINLKSKKAYYLAESGTEDAMYRLKNGWTISSSESITIDSNTTTTVITSGNNQKEIISLADVNSFQRKVGLILKTGAGVAFNYGLQAGNDGVVMNGGSTIRGNIYSNGDINATGGSTITGSAIAADSAALLADQTNDTPIPSSSTIVFANTSATQDFAQSFQISTTEPINKMQFYIKKYGSPADETIKIVADNNGSPSTTVIDSATLSAGLITTNPGWVDVVFANAPSLIPETTYWIVIDGSYNTNKYYTLGANADSSYLYGTAKVGTFSSGSWTAKNLDGYFKIYTGGIASKIGGATYVGGVQIGGDAWATTVKGTNTAGNLYCTNGTYNNKSCDTSHGTPAPQPMPFSEANIQDWKDDAVTGGIITGATSCPGGYSSGNCTVNWQNATFGPGKITGNLLVNGGGTLTLTGTVWVVGTVTVTGGGKIKLPQYYALNSGTIISDNIMTIQGGGSLGSGTPGSYLFLVSTSKCPNDINCSGVSAINVSGGAGAIAVDAQYGNVALSGGADLNAATGKSISVTGGTEVIYDQGLASPSFSSGPSGSWVVDTWKEAE